MTEGNIFVVEFGGGLQRLSESPFKSEDDFQDLIPGGEIDPKAPRRWLFLTREAPIADRVGGGGRWAPDHLFVYQEAISTSLKVKRRGDMRVRRKVVGPITKRYSDAR